MFERIRVSLVDKPYQNHVVRPFYAIENKLGADDQAVRISVIFVRHINITEVLKIVIDQIRL